MSAEQTQCGLQLEYSWIADSRRTSMGVCWDRRHSILDREHTRNEGAGIVGNEHVFRRYCRGRASNCIVPLLEYGMAPHTVCGKEMVISNVANFFEPEGSSWPITHLPRNDRRPFRPWGGPS